MPFQTPDRGVKVGVPPNSPGGSSLASGSDFASVTGRPSASGSPATAVTAPATGVSLLVAASSTAAGGDLWVWLPHDDLAFVPAKLAPNSRPTAVSATDSSSLVAMPKPNRPAPALPRALGLSQTPTVAASTITIPASSGSKVDVYTYVTVDGEIRQFPKGPKELEPLSVSAQVCRVWHVCIVIAR